MKNLLNPAAVLVALAGPVFAAPQDGTSPALPETWKMERHELREAGWGNQVSHTILAPLGWKVEGGSWYGPDQAFRVFASQNVVLTAPDGRMITIGPDIPFVDKTLVTAEGLKRLPNMSLDDGSIVLHYPETPRGFAKVIVDSLKDERPKAKGWRIVDARPIPEATEPLLKSLEPTVRMLQNQASMNMGTRLTVDASVLSVELAYREDGKKWSEVHAFSQCAFRMTMPSPWNQLGYAGSDTWTNWSINGGLSFRAPKEGLDELAFIAMAVRSTLRPTQAWLQMQARHRAKIQQISHEMAMDNLRTAAKISRIQAQSSADIFEIQSKGYAERQAMRDEGHRRTINTINEVQEYQVPGAEYPVALPSYYERVFSNGNGEYLLTNDLSYEPGSDNSLSGDWTALKPVR